MINDPTLPPLPAQPEGTPWPTDEWPTGELPESIRDPVERLFEKASSDPDAYGRTDAFLVVQSGKIVFERYGAECGPQKTYPSWSKAKSITHALAGIAIYKGALQLHSPAAVPEWRDAGDPRSGITLEQLLRMVSGLEFNEDYENSGVSHTIEMLWGEGKPDVAHYAASRPAEHKPGSFWSYSSGTTNIVCRLIASALNLDRSRFEQFMRARLFDPIGMRSALPKFDHAGTFVGSSFCFCTARDFARFGLLYLRNGIWNGTRILPEGWVDHARTPTPTVPQEEPMGYGAHWWLGLAGPGSFSANGYDGQYTVLVPEKDLIFVRHGASEAQKETVRDWLAEVAASFN